MMEFAIGPNTAVIAARGVPFLTLTQPRVACGAVTPLYLHTITCGDAPGKAHLRELRGDILDVCLRGWHVDMLGVFVLDKPRIDAVAELAEHAWVNTCRPGSPLEGQPFTEPKEPGGELILQWLAAPSFLPVAANRVAQSWNLLQEGVVVVKDDRRHPELFAELSLVEAPVAGSIKIQQHRGAAAVVLPFVDGAATLWDAVNDILPGQRLPASLTLVASDLSSLPSTTCPQQMVADLLYPIVAEQIVKQTAAGGGRRSSRHIYI